MLEGREVTIAKPDTIVHPTDTGDHDRFAHYIWGSDPAARITEAIVMGTPVVALCGKVWVPSRKAEDYPICQKCKEIRDQILGRSDD